MMNAYEKIEKLGEGGQGKVYKVRRRRDGAVVVLKMINCSDASFQKHAETEIKVMEGLAHPHVVKMHESFIYKGNRHTYICIVMEYCEGGDLFKQFCKIRKEKGKFEEAQVKDWLVQMASALDYLHKKDLWHRDVKTANILFDKDGRLKLGDFGLSATYNSKGHATVVGTPYYFAPELMLHEKYTNKVDIWNAGVVVLELMTLKQQPINVQVLCEKGNAREKVLKLAAERGYSEKLGVLVASMLSRAAEDRPAAREVVRELSASGASVPNSSGTASTVGPVTDEGDDRSDNSVRALRQQLEAKLAAGAVRRQSPSPSPKHRTNASFETAAGTGTGSFNTAREGSSQGSGDQPQPSPKQQLILPSTIKHQVERRQRVRNREEKEQRRYGGYAAEPAAHQRQARPHSPMGRRVRAEPNRHAGGLQKEDVALLQNKLAALANLQRDSR